MLTNSQLAHFWTNNYTSNVITNVLTNLTGTGTAPIWQTVFFDDFNRADTAWGDIGNNWYIITNNFQYTNNGMMKISNNEVYSEIQETGVSFSTMPCAVYKQSVNFTNKIVKISTKFKTDSSTGNFFCIAAWNNNLSENFSCGIGQAVGLGDIYTSCTYNNATGFTNISSTNYTITLNTYYLIEFIIDSTNLNVIHKDLPNSNILCSVSTITYTNINPSKIVISGNQNQHKLFFDDLKIEKFE